jgi:hypothetical protein
MDNPRLELGTNGLRVRCSTIELVILVVRIHSTRVTLLACLAISLATVSTAPQGLQMTLENGI